jgi:hypothetical protein
MARTTVKMADGRKIKLFDVGFDTSLPGDLILIDRSHRRGEPDVTEKRYSVPLDDAYLYRIDGSGERINIGLFNRITITPECA